MKYINDLKPSNDPMSYWGNAMKDTVRENTTIVGTDFNSYINAGGTNLELAPKYRYPITPDVYRGEWDITGSYLPGDIVRVMPNFDYIEYNVGTDKMHPGSLFSVPEVILLGLNGNVVTDPLIPGYSFQPQQLLVVFYNIAAINRVLQILMLYIKPIPGVYRCCAPIPGMFDYYNIATGGGFVNDNRSNINAFQVSYRQQVSYTSVPIQPFVGSLIRFLDINYFPVWPELPTVAEIDTSNYLKANGRYWELLSSLPMAITTTTCKNGVTSTITKYVDGFERPTGSYLNATSSYYPQVP